MEKEVKKSLWKVFSIAAFLFITIFYIFPYLVQLSTYLHEQAHIDALDAYGIEASYSYNLLDTIPQFFVRKSPTMGITSFSYNQYVALSADEKLNVNIAGMISDLRLLFLVGIFLSFLNIYMFYKIRIKKSTNLIWILAVNWILFMWLLYLIQSTYTNLTSSGGDIFQLVSMLR